ncbi:C3 and PZP-like alpha-2-macroglobulin domain-containing protein 8, partial [Lingula anatina]|uniref:C3 and PZP-like alpha-2-macroglobulin domain-containing protein 8 n=1 Tax=Lingula anatina TaxID=7574 RepID=A0A1S3I7K9_LINAN
VSLKGSSTARAVKSPNPFETRSGQQMQITLKDVDSVSQAGGNIVFQLRSTSSLSKVSYQIISRGTIHSVGEQVFASAATRQEFTITADSNMAPKARILVYFLTADGEMIVDSVDFTVEGAFRNDVSVRFTNPSNTEITQSELGKDVTFEVTAAAGSFVGCLAVDQSVLLLKSGNDITQAEVLAELEEYDVKDTSGGFNPCLRGEPCIMAKRKKRSFWWPYPIGGNNAFDLLKEAGMLVMTDAYLKKDLVLYPILEERPIAGIGGGIMDGALAPAEDSSESGRLAAVTTVRKAFPESWLWSEMMAGSDGRVSFETKVPDTITSWVASAFAVSDTMGLGVGSTPAKLRAFKPFFVTVNLPYSVVRGEQLELKAIVFNYMGVDQTVTVTLKRSTAFKVQGKEESSNKIDSGLAFAEVKNVIKVPAGGGTSTSFWIVPQDLGGVKVEVHAQSTSAADGMEKMLLVKPEGKLQEVAQSFLVNVTSSTPFQQTLQLPIANASTLVPGSEYITVSAIGDIMGSTLDGLERLVRQPTGCGEQNMLGLVPNIVVRKYLEGVNKLSDDIRAKTTKFMKLGYERELNYQHDDGSFSAFGNNDNSGSMWLTAFVMKSFHQLKMLNDPEVFIDPAIINNATSWILKKQSKDGSFPEPGNVIHKDMQGKAGSGTSLTAYVASALAEAQASVSSSDSATSLADAMRFLETELSSITDPYILSIMAYAFIKAGKQSLADQTLAKLEPMATEKDGMKFWEDQSDPMPVSGSRFYHHQAKSSSIEMTSYVLLTYLAKRDLITGVPMMKWLTSQRNGHGGFRSTQDTVMGLTALAEFAALSGNTNKNLQITVTTDQDVESSFTPITDQNDLVLQKIQLEKSTREVTIRVTGTGVGLIQVSSIFNVKAGGYKKANYIKTFPETGDSGSSSENNGIALRVSVQESEDKNSMEAQVCGRWTGVDRSGMVTLEYGVVSGYAADADQLRKQDGIKKVETEDQKLVAYFDELPTDEKCWMVKAQRVAAVTNVQEAPITLSAYYQNDVETTVFYQPQAQKTMCEVCPECVGCTNTAGQGGGNKTSGSSAATYGIVTIVLATLTAIMF